MTKPAWPLGQLRPRKIALRELERRTGNPATPYSRTLRGLIPLNLVGPMAFASALDVSLDEIVARNQPLAEAQAGPRKDNGNKVT